MTGNIAEVLVVFIGIFIVSANNGEIFSPLQLLYLNLITDSVPAIMLAYEKEAKDIMTRPVQKKSKSFFTVFLSARIVVSAIFKTTAILGVFMITQSTTAAFFTLVLSEMAFAYSCRNLEVPIWENYNVNKNLNLSMLLLLLVQGLFFFTPARQVMGLTQMSLVEIALSAAVVIVIFVLDEALKPVIVRLTRRGVR